MLRSSSAKKVNGCGNGSAAEEADVFSEAELEGSAVIGGRRQASDSVTLLNEGGKDYGSAANGAGGASNVGIRALSVFESCLLACQIHGQIHRNYRDGMKGVP